MDLFPRETTWKATGATVHLIRSVAPANSTRRFAMKKRLVYTMSGIALGVAATLYLSGSLGVWAQLSERPGTSLDNPIDLPRDLSGLSIKIPRIRVLHTKDPTQKGGSMYLQTADPWLGYQWGRFLTQRNFRHQDG